MYTFLSGKEVKNILQHCKKSTEVAPVLARCLLTLVGWWKFNLIVRNANKLWSLRGEGKSFF